MIISSSIQDSVTYPMVLVGGDGGEACLLEDEGAIGHRAGRWALSVGRKVHHMQTRLVAMHGVQDYLPQYFSF